MSSILTNTGAMVALQTLKGINSSLNSTQNEIATGKKVGSAKDNSAVWAISKVMEADVRGFRGISESLSLGESTVAVARQASESITGLLTEMKGKIVAAQEENVDRGKIQADIVNLRDQINSVVNAAQFNGLNLVKGSESVNILSSLDRSADGTVANSSIQVNRQDLSTDGAIAGTEESEDLAANATIDGLDDGDLVASRTTDAITFTGALGAAEGGDYDLVVSVGDADFNISVTLANDQTADDIAAAIRTAVTNAVDADHADYNEALASALGGGSIAAGGTDATNLTFSVTGTHADVSFDLSAIGALATTVGGAGQTAGVAELEATAATVTFANTTAMVAGDTFRVSIDGTDYDYTLSQTHADEADAFTEISEGLAAAIGAGTGLTATATDGVLSVAKTTAGDVSFEITALTGGTAAGGLNALTDIDVSTQDGAADALASIESMIQTAIDSSAAFGSVQGRIEIQSEFVSKLTDSLRAGIGTLVDADMEETSARLQALQVQQQLAIQSLSIANQAPQNILSLFR